MPTDLPPRPPPPQPADAQNQDLPGARGGRMMLYLGWIGIAAALAWFFSGVETKRNNPNQGSQSEFDATTGSLEIALVQNPYGHYVANGTINGYPVTFLLDTGATNVSVPQALAREIGLDEGPAFVAQTANGEAQMFATMISDLEIGGMHFRNLDASINPNVGDMEVLLGMSALRDVELTQRDRTLTIRVRPPLGQTP